MYKIFTEFKFGHNHASIKIIRVMKLTCTLLMLAIMQVSASSYAQKITLEVKNVPFEGVMVEIQRQSGYDFLYSAQLIKMAGPVSLSLKNVSLTQALDKFFDHQPFTYVVNQKTITITSRPAAEREHFAEMINVKGKVSDNSGNPLPGVSVRLKGTTTGTITAGDGTYTLNVPDGKGVLAFSYVGFVKQEITLNGESTVNVTLVEDKQALTEVMVTGYSTQSKHTLTSAIVSVKGEELVKRVATDPASLLQGQLPGLSVVQNSGEPGNESLKLRIRGIGTFSGAGTDPLVIVDGLPGSLSVINPNDIESATVLKDAAAATIYGSRGANGVIVIKTKKGKAGGFALTYNYNIGFSSPTRLPKLITNSALYMELLNEALVNTGNAKIYEQSQIDLYKNATDRVKYPNHNWLDDMFSTAVVQNHYLNLSGGNENTTYSLGLGYTDQPGTMLGFDYKKYTVDLGLSSKVNKRVTLGTNIQIRYGDRQYPFVNSTDLYISALAQTPLYPAQTEDGKWISKAYPKEMNNKNPILAASVRTHNPDYYGQGNISLDVNILKGLTWENRAGLSFDLNKSKTFKPSIPLYLYNDMSSYGNQDFGSSQGLTVNQNDDIHSTIYSQLNYTTDFGKQHLTILGGVQQEVDNYSQLNAFRTGYPTNALTELDAGSASGQTNNGTSSSWVIHSLYGNANYSFDDKYLLGASIRYDGSSRLPASSRWGLYESFSAGWRISKEDFLKDVTWINDLKLRGSWGVLGNQNIGNYPYQLILSQNNYAFAGNVTTGFTPNTLVDPDLTWENTRMTDIGLDLSAFNNRLNFTADWFSKYTSDILRSSQVPLWLGLNPPTVNNGAVRNKGFEFSLRYQDKIGQDFTYYAVANFQTYRNKLTSFGQQEITGPDGQTIMKDGYPINSFYLQTMDGIFQSQDEINHSPDQSALGGVPTPGDIKYKDTNGDGKVDANDRTVMDGQYPKFEYSYTMGANWKNFDISVQLYGSYGNKVYLYKWGVDPFAQGAPPTEEWVNRWTPQNPSATMPKIYLGYYGYSKITGVQSTYHLYNASFMRIKNIQLGYTIPAKLTHGIKSIRVFSSIDNVALFTPLKQGTDPERLDISNKPDAWYGFANYPQIRTYTFGASVQF